MTADSLAIVYGLASAAVWGAGDFSGGLAAKRTDVFRVVLFAHVVGLCAMFGLALYFGERAPTYYDLLFGALAGLAGMIGVLAFYQGLSQSRMGVVAPIAAMVTAIIPIAVGIWYEGIPLSSQLIGFGIALYAVWLLAGGEGMANVKWRELSFPIVAGFGFAFFLVFIDRVTDSAVFWPLAASRGASIAFLLALSLFRPTKSPPSVNQWPIIAAAGIFDAGGNAFFTLAAQAGRLDIASVLSSLYPATTVLLAWFLLGERLTARQWWGAGLALVALVLITI